MIKICGRNDVPKNLPVDYVISLYDSKKEAPEFFMRDRHLAIRVDDVIRQTEVFFSSAIYPSMDMIQRIINFVDGKERKDFVIHCEMGMSRSPAVAWGVLVHWGYSPQEAFDAIRRQYPYISPNYEIVRLWDEHFRDTNMIKILEDTFPEYKGGVTYKMKGP